MEKFTKEQEVLPDFNDESVQKVYEILCDNVAPPFGQHHEGYDARRIVAAIRDQEAAKVARLRELLARFEYNEYGPKRFPTEEEIESALSAMQPTVDAFVARIKAEAKIEELKEVIDAVCQLANDSTYHVATCVYREVEERMCARLAELRNAKDV